MPPASLATVQVVHASQSDEVAAAAPHLALHAVNAEISSAQQVPSKPLVDTLMHSVSSATPIVSSCGTVSPIVSAGIMGKDSSRMAPNDPRKGSKPVSYANLVKGPSVLFIKLPAIPTMTAHSQFLDIDGVPSISFEVQDIDNSSSLFKYCLVARFSDRRPSVDEFETFFNSSWGLKHAAVVELLDPKYFMICCVDKFGFEHV